jgi:hypothetical protein
VSPALGVGSGLGVAIVDWLADAEAWTDADSLALGLAAGVAAVGVGDDDPTAMPDDGRVTR